MLSLSSYLHSYPPWAIKAKDWNENNRSGNNSQHFEVENADAKTNN